jgi:hypothetical protein
MLRNLLEGVFGPDSTRRLAAFSYVGRLNENSTNSLSIRQQTLTSTQSEWAALRITVTEGAATRFEVAYRTDTVSRAGARAIVAEFEARLRGLVGPEARFGGDGYGNLRRRR